MLNFKKSITVIALSFLICRSGFTGETELLISAASSTTDVLKALIAQFEEYNPDMRPHLYKEGAITIHLVDAKTK